MLKLTNPLTFRALRILVTNQCNLACAYCHNEGQSRGDSVCLLPRRFEVLAGAAYSLGVRHFQFSGGEPALHPLLEQMVASAQELGNDVTVGLTTNGTLLADRDINWIARTMSNVRVNLPTLSSPRYATITGRDFGMKVVGRVRRMAEAGVHVGINVVYYDQRIGEIAELIEFAGAIGADVKVLDWVSESYRDVKRDTGELANYLGGSSASRLRSPSSVELFLVASRLAQVCVRLVHSPCADRDANACRERGEARLRADGVLEGCLHATRCDPACETLGTKEEAIAELSGAAGEISRCPA